MVPTKYNVGALANQSGYITVNATARIPLQTTSDQNVDFNSVVTPEVSVGNCRCTETVGLMWQPDGLQNAHYVTKWSSPDQGFYWQNDVKNEGNPMPLMRLHKDGHLYVEGDLHCNQLHEQNPGSGQSTNNLTVSGTLTATVLSVPSVLSTASDTLEALSGLNVTGTLTTANGNVDTRLAALETSTGTLTSTNTTQDTRLTTLETTATTQATTNSSYNTRITTLETADTTQATTNSAFNTRITTLESNSTSTIVLNIATTNTVTVSTEKTMFANAGIFTLSVANDTNSMYSAGVVTVPSTGYYLMNLDLSCTHTGNGSPVITTTVYKNGSTQLYQRPNVRISVSTSGRTDINYVTVLSLTQGDTISVTFVETSAVSMGVADGTRFILTRV